jgi:hypothetical protein
MFVLISIALSVVQQYAGLTGTPALAVNISAYASHALTALCFVIAIYRTIVPAAPPAPAPMLGGILGGRRRRHHRRH